MFFVTVTDSIDQRESKRFEKVDLERFALYKIFNTVIESVPTYWPFLKDVTPGLSL